MTAYLEDLFSPGRGRYGWPVSSSAYDVDLVDSILDEVDPASVLDPLCGVGTVNLACSYRGVGCVGLEPDPFRQTVASAKLRMYREDTYEECGYACARVCDNLFWEDEKYDVPDSPSTILSGFLHANHPQTVPLRPYCASFAMPASMSSRFTPMYFSVSVVDSWPRNGVRDQRKEELRFVVA